jgi:hypothetical protein
MEDHEKIPYSPLELRVLKNIPKDGKKISTIALTNLCYSPSKKPLNARNSILDTTNKLIAKSDLNEEEWEIFKSKQKGAQPVYFWIEQRKR